LLITAVVVEKRSVPEVAVQYDVSRSWLYELLARYRREGEAAFEPRSRRPRSAPTALSADVVDLIIRLRKELSDQGLDAGPDTIRWHLEHHHDLTVSRATVARYLTRAGLVTPEPKKRPRSSYIRFQAAMPNECWQADFTHYRLTRPDSPARLGHRDPDLAGRLLPLCPEGNSACPHHRPDRAHLIPLHRSPARLPGLHVDRQRPWSSPPACPEESVVLAPATGSSTNSASTA
jgi:transposase